MLKLISVSFVLLALCSSFVAPATKGKVLFLLPLSSKSHRNVFDPLIKELAARGHEVVAVSPFPQKHKGVREISPAGEAVHKLLNIFGNPVETRAKGKWEEFTMGPEPFVEACHAVYQDAAFMALQKEKFDVVFLDTILNDCILGFVYKLGAPLVQWTTFPAGGYLTELIGNRLPPSFVPSPFFSLPDRMNFFQRCLNVGFGFFIDFIFLRNLKDFDQVGRHYLGDDIPDWSTLNANMSMLFMNSHFALNYPRPVLPDVVEVGGMHCQPAKSLPEDLHAFASGAKDGLILFSLGSIVQGNQLPDATRRIFLNTFAKLKQRVLWKWESETMPEKLPPNVKLSKWIPQQDVLGHPNTKLFISHGGLLSMQEAVYHAKPMIMIPIFGDQDLNAEVAVSLGFARMIEILEVTEEKLEEAIQDILSDSKYTTQVQKLSVLYRDQPETPLARATYWAEYLIRHKGAKHLRSAARELNFIQYYCLDVAAFFITILLAILWGIKKIVMKLFRCVFPSKVTKAKKTQ